LNEIAPPRQLNRYVANSSINEDHGMRLILIVAFLSLTPIFTRGQQIPPACRGALRYDNTRPESFPLSFNHLSGRVIDSKRAVVPHACVGLFTWPDRQLLSAFIANKEGRFSFRNLASGRYLLLVQDRSATLDPAQVLIRIEHNNRRRHQLLIHMGSAGPLTGSWGYYK
jgi:hypothetical protein